MSSLTGTKQQVLKAKRLYEDFSSVQYKVFAMKQELLHGNSEQVFYDEYKRLAGEMAEKEIEVIKEMELCTEMIENLPEEDKLQFDIWRKTVERKS